MWLQLETIKKHLNIDDAFTEDDNYLMALGNVAETSVAKHIDSDFYKIAQENDGELPSPLLHACLLLIGNLYNNREAVTYTTTVEVPLSYNYLLDLYKDYHYRGEYTK